MASLENIVVSPDVTLQVIEEAKGVNKLSELAAKFTPPVSTDKCMNVSEKRERLRCAYRKAKGASINLQSFAHTMEELKVTDSTMRQALTELFKQARQAVTEGVRLDNLIDGQLQQEESTKNYAKKIEIYLKLLEQEECPLVMAGQVSSGKSTLLNLFLGREVLPHQLLSCTATICELKYADTDKAQLLMGDGSLKPIEFEERDKYIFKSDERDRRFDHEAIRLHMKVPFLKSGVILVDTPGIGENKEMGSVLTDYVAKHDVFGFIFAIKCDDSGGVLSRFKEMLRQLSMIKDSQGQFKFDPKSIIFVANFWDKVKKEEKPDVKRAIEETLRRETCLKGIDLDNQLFFVNSRFAWHTWQAGLVSEDYEKLIKAVDRFFPIGHKQKLKLAYMWLENLLLRVHHPIKAFLHTADCTKSQIGRNVKAILKALDKTKNMAIDAQRIVKEKWEDERHQLREKLQTFLSSADAKQAVTKWQSANVPKVEFGDSWVLVEENIENEINARISSVLQEWEVKEKNFVQSETAILKTLKSQYGPVLAELDAVEKNIRNMAGGKQERASRVSLDGMDVDDTPREFTVNVAQKVTHDPSASQSFLKQLMSNPASLFYLSKGDKQQAREKNAELFKVNKIKFMEEKSKEVLSYLKGSDKRIKQLVDEQLQTTGKNLDAVHINTISLIFSNCTLADQLDNDERQSSQLEQTFRPLAQRIDHILEKTVSFSYDNIHEYDFPEGSFRELTPSRFTREKGKQKAILGTITQVKTADNQTMTVKQLQPDKRRYLFYLARNARMLSSYRQVPEFIPVFLGIGSYQREPGLVYQGHVTTARQHLQSQGRGNKGRSGRRFFVQNDLPDFMLSVSRGVEFLHLRKLYHIELSLDSIYVQDGKPKLSNMFESMEVVYPDSNVPAANYVYMAPETFPTNGRKRYSAAADVYALGLMFLELWAQCDLYGGPADSQKPRPKEQLLQTFMQDADPGRTLYQCIDLVDPELTMNIPQELIMGCLCANPVDRFSIRHWIEELKKFKGV